MPCSLVARHQLWYLSTKLQSVTSQKTVFVTYLGHLGLLKETHIRKWLINGLVEKFSLFSIPRGSDGDLQSFVLWRQIITQTHDFLYSVFHEGKF
jgi:hypothetical protein